MTKAEKIERHKEKEAAWNTPVVFGKMKQYFWAVGTIVVIIGTLVSMVVNSALIAQGAQSETNVAAKVSAAIAKHDVAGHKNMVFAVDDQIQKTAITDQLAKVAVESVAARKVMSDQLAKVSTDVNVIQIQIESVKDELEKSEMRQVKSTDDLRNTLNLILLEMRK